MMKPTTLRDADAPGAGGGTTLENNPAGGAAPTDPAPPTAFDWNTPIPDNAPKGLQSLKGKPMLEIERSYIGIQQRATRAEQELAKLKGVKTDDKPNPIVGLGNLAAQFVEADGQLDETSIANFVETHGVPPEAVDTLNEFLDFVQARNNQFMTAAQEALGTDVNAKDLMKWLRSGESEFTPEEITGFTRLANSGRLGWMTDVKESFIRAATANPLLVTQRGTPPAAPKPGTPPRRPRPFSEPANQPTFSGYKAYVKALKDAEMSGNYQAKMEVHKQMMAIPEHIRESPEWKNG